MARPLTIISHPAPSIDVPSELAVEKPDERKIAVILNRNARRVSDSIAKQVERIVGRDHVYYSHSLEEAEASSSAAESPTTRNL